MDNGGAAKVDTCMELIRNARAAGNQVLLFSQFTQALEVLRELLEKENPHLSVAALNQMQYVAEVVQKYMGIFENV